MSISESAGVGTTDGRKISVLPDRGQEGTFGWFTKADLGSTFFWEGDMFLHKLILFEKDGGTLAGLALYGPNIYQAIPLHSSVRVSGVKSVRQFIAERERAVEAAVRNLEEVSLGKFDR